MRTPPAGADRTGIAFAVHGMLQHRQRIAPLLMRVNADPGHRHRLQHGRCADGAAIRAMDVGPDGLGTLSARRRHRRARHRRDARRGVRAGCARADGGDHRSGAGRARRPRSRSRCEAPDDELLLVDWLNALIYEMATRHMLFGRFAVSLRRPRARGQGVGRAGRSRAAPAGGRGQGRDLHGVVAWRAATTACGSRSASSTCEGEARWIPDGCKRIDDCEWRCCRRRARCACPA